MRLQKYLASMGIASRRKIEHWIRNERITINGRLAKLGVKVSGQEIIKKDNQIILCDNAKIAHKHLIYNKRNDEITTRKDPKNRKTVFESLPRLDNQRWISIGRLDLTTTGLLLFTTDGDLANNLMHPSSGIIRNYLTRISGKASKSEIDLLKRGVMLSDGLASFFDVKFVSSKKLNSWYEVSLNEGRNHEVKRLWEKIGYKVSKLKRISFGPINLSRTIKPGSYVCINNSGVKTLYDSVKNLSSIER